MAYIATALSMAIEIGGWVAANWPHAMSQVILRCVAKPITFDKSGQSRSTEQQENQKSGVIPLREH